MNTRIIFFAVLLVAAAGLVATAFFGRTERVTIEGAVLVDAQDADQQAPIAGVEVGADGLAVETRSDASGFFRLLLPAGVKPGSAVTLAFRHAEHRPVDVPAVAGDRLVIARMAPVIVRRPPGGNQPETPVAHVRIRYSTAARNVVNVGAGARMFEVKNAGNVPCDGHELCSPDGRWKAALASATIDAGPENEFHSTRVSCIAGPCPFTRIETDNFSRGGRVIGVTIRNWSDTTTFVLQGEVVRAEISNVVRTAFPIILGRAMTFTLPAAAEGPSVEAELGGQPIVFPLGPNLFLSWATCDARPGEHQSKIYRCALKAGYRFAE